MTKDINRIDAIHKSVLLKEIISILETPKYGVYLDGTINNGGHAKAVADNLNGKITIIGFDKDSNALARAKKNLKGKAENLILVSSDFKDLDKTVLKAHLEGKIDSILLDLGISSDQLENSKRGFSFKKDEPLLMTMKDKVSKSDLTAYEIVNSWDEENIASIIYGYGEEKYSRRIAKAIIEERKKRPINSSKELSEIIFESYPARERHKKIHPATKTFQALRIAVNDELGSLKEGIEKSFAVLKKGGRIAIISFHSLEDRIVKKYFREIAKSGLGKLITKKPIIAKADEIKENPRSRSAKLRVLEKAND